jgi:hypothetical protein
MNLRRRVFGRFAGENLAIVSAYLVWDDAT